MEVELGLRPAGVGAVVFKPLSAGEFVRAENEMQELLDVAARESSSRIERRSDDYGYEWLIVRDEQFEDLVTTVHLVAGELAERGFGPQLLAAVTGSTAGSIPSTSCTATSEARSGRSCRPGARARQRRGAGAEGEAGERAAHRAGHLDVVRPLRPPDLARRLLAVPVVERLEARHQPDASEADLVRARVVGDVVGVRQPYMSTFIPLSPPRNACEICVPAGRATTWPARIGTCSSS